MEGGAKAAFQIKVSEAGEALQRRCRGGNGMLVC